MHAGARQRKSARAARNAGAVPLRVAYNYCRIFGVLIHAIRGIGHGDAKSTVDDTVGVRGSKLPLLGQALAIVRVDFLWQPEQQQRDRQSQNGQLCTTQDKVAGRGLAALVNVRICVPVAANTLRTQLRSMFR